MPRRAIAAWVPLLPAPDFPEYPCSHCIVSAAIGELMKSESGLPASAGIRAASLAVANSAEPVLPSWDEWVKHPARLPAAHRLLPQLAWVRVHFGGWITAPNRLLNAFKCAL